MIDFDNLDRTSNIVCRINSTLVIKHIVEFKQPHPNKKNDKFSTYGFYYDNNNRPNVPEKFKNYTGGNLMFSGNGYISVENKRNVVRQESVLSETLRVKIVLMDTPQLLAVLDTVAEWLTTQCEDVFMNDDLGHPIKIINPMLKVTCPLMLEALGITFKPCIVEDNIGTKYQGVAMGNREKGEICNFTATEFIVFKNMMAYALNNLYTNNMLLATHTMQYCMYKNLMEVLNKNAQRNKPQ